MNTSLADNLSQSERLAYYADTRFSQEQAPSPRFPRPPTITQVREHDARLMLHGSICNVTEDIGDDEESEESEESELRDYAYAIRAESLKEHSFRLPSQRSRADVREALRFMNCTFHD